MRYYPVFLNLRGRRCVVVGGGRVAERKVMSLLRARAAVHLISPELTPRLAALAARKKIGYTPRPYRKGDLQRPVLVFAATDDPETQRRIWEEAERVGAFINLADDRKRSDFLVPASFARGGLQVAISTAGSSPALARLLRLELQARLGEKSQARLRLLRELRKRLPKYVRSQDERARVFRRLAEGALAAGLGRKGQRLAAEWVQELLRGGRGRTLRPRKGEAERKAPTASRSPRRSKRGRG